MKSWDKKYISSGAVFPSILKTASLTTKTSKGLSCQLALLALIGDKSMHLWRTNHQYEPNDFPYETRDMIYSIEGCKGNGKIFSENKCILNVNKISSENIIASCLKVHQWKHLQTFYAKETTQIVYIEKSFKAQVFAIWNESSNYNLAKRKASEIWRWDTGDNIAGLLCLNSRA